jgi:hypothetical protein
MFDGGECPHCDETIQEGEMIRADGLGSYEHQDCVDEEDREVEDFDFSSWFQIS